MIESISIHYLQYQTAMREVTEDGRGTLCQKQLIDQGGLEKRIAHDPVDEGQMNKHAGELFQAVVRAIGRLVLI